MSTRPVVGLAVGLLTVFVDMSLAAQVPPPWIQLDPDGPSARDGHAMAYDSPRGKTVLFGGYGGSLLNFAWYLSDTWQWDGLSWTQVASTGPSARNEHAMAYDSQRDTTVLFGGYDASGYNGQTWEWNGAAWQPLPSAVGPSARRSHAMAYDSQRGKTVLFGGWDASSTARGDSWEWDGSSWTQVATTGPPARMRHAMAYDSQRGKTVLFGGYEWNTGSYFGDSWEWDGASWTQVSATGPAARWYHAMAYDNQRGTTVLLGGVDASSNYFGDSWEWDGGSWTQRNASGPSGRFAHAMAYDSQRGRAVMFGGFDNSGRRGDTWEWNSQQPAVALRYGAGCGSPVLDLAPMATAGPIVGATGQAALTAIPSPPAIAFVALGWSRTTSAGLSLPLSLAGLGMPGCDLLQSAEAAAVPTTATGPGTATCSLPLPNWNGLLGLQLYLQGWAVAPGVNPGGTVTSNGVEWILGNV